MPNLRELDACEFIWEAGVGFAGKTTSSAAYDSNRAELLRLLLACFSEIIYAPVDGERRPTISSMLIWSSLDENRMRWITRFASAENGNVRAATAATTAAACRK